jgi:hypothetical protein
VGLKRLKSNENEMKLFFLSPRAFWLLLMFAIARSAARSLVLFRE